MTFEELYMQNYEPIFKFCFRFLNSREKAMDVTQDTFLKLYQQMNKGDYQIENPRAWLYKVAGNKSLNLINTANRQKEIKEQLEFLSTKNIESRNAIHYERKHIKNQEGYQRIETTASNAGLNVSGWIVI